jgi:hypothetical protein
MTPGEVQVLASMLGGNREACEALGVSESTLMRYKRGDRAIPQDLAERLRDRAFGRLSGPPSGPLPDENISLLGTRALGGPDSESIEDGSEAAE